MRIPDKLYNILKWVCVICIPAIITFLAVVLPAVGVEAGVINTVTTILAATATLIGTLIGISTAEYNKNK